MRRLVSLISFLLPALSSMADLWQPPISLTMVTRAGDYATVPQVAIHANSGDAIAAWLFYDQSSNTQNIQAAHYTLATQTWCSPLPLTAISNSGDAAMEVQVSVDQTTGNGIAIWTFYDKRANTQNIQASHYSTQTHSWSEPVSLTKFSKAGEFASSPQIKVDPTTGNAIAVWMLHDQNAKRQSIQSASFTVLDNGWSAPVPLTKHETDSANSPQIAIDSATGNCIAVWTCYNRTLETYNVASATYTQSARSWSAPIFLTPVVSTGDGAMRPQVRIDSTTGNALVVWTVTDGATSNIHSSFYTKSSRSWRIPTPITTITTRGQHASSPQIGICTETGDAVAMWILSDHTAKTENIQSSTYSSNTRSWSAPVALTTMASGDYADGLQMSVDSTTGDAVAIWAFHNSGTHTHNIHSSTYHSNTYTWSPPNSLTTLATSGDFAFVPHLDIDRKKRAIATWIFFDSITSVLNIQSSTLN